MFLLSRNVGEGGLGDGDQDVDDPFEGSGSAHCTCFRRGVGAGRLLGEGAGQDEEMGVGEVAGEIEDGAAKRMEARWLIQRMGTSGPGG